MKIVVVANEFYPIVGGGQNHILNIYKRLVKKGHKVSIFTMYDTGIKNAPRIEYYDGIRVERFPAFRMHKPFFYPFSFELLSKLMKEDYDVLQFNCFDIVGFYGFILKKLKKSKYFVHTHGFSWEAPTLLSKMFIPFFNFFIVKPTMKYADGVFCVSLHDKKEVGRVRKKNVYYVSTAVDTKLFKIRHRKRNKVVVGEIARINKVKNQEALVLAAAEVVKKHKNIEFVLAGIEEDKNYLKHLRKLISNLGLSSHFKIYTNVDKSKIYDIYSAIDIYVLPSLFEGEPVSVIEAWAAGSAVISSPAGGTKYVIKNGYNGYLVEPKDYKTLAERISNLVKDERKRKLLASRGMKQAKEFHNWERIASFIEKSYANALVG